LAATVVNMSRHFSSNKFCLSSCWNSAAITSIPGQLSQHCRHVIVQTTGAVEEQHHQQHWEQKAAEKNVTKAQFGYNPPRHVWANFANIRNNNWLTAYKYQPVYIGFKFCRTMAQYSAALVHN
jgi:hypothetical protein